eukprot:gb/GECG01016082.1/.p1 GENE.gb/GECG01016082.1/~~gb/GECG01016082.1/.p1  ORF type:complete len:925 (+),score=80.58 gb/GECG01016082.1/:1-2775(+)
MEGKRQDNYSNPLHGSAMAERQSSPSEAPNKRAKANGRISTVNMLDKEETKQDHHPQLRNQRQKQKQATTGPRRVGRGRKFMQQLLRQRGEPSRRGSVVWEDPEQEDWLLRLLLASCCRRRWHEKLEEREERAVLLVRNAKHGRPTAFPSKDSLAARLIYHGKLNTWLTGTIALGYMLLAQWEEPSTDQSSRVWVTLLELFAQIYFLVQLRIEWLYFDRHLFFQKTWSVAKLITIPLMLLSLILSLSVPGFPHFARVFRPIFLLDRFRNIRKIASNILETLPRILNVAVLLGFVIVVFGVTAHIFFAGMGDGSCSVSTSPAQQPRHCSTFTQECEDYFNTLDNSMMEMFTLSTTTNFPDIMLPVYRCNAWNSLFFVVYVVISVYLLFSLILAVAFTEFKSLTEKKVLERFANMFQGCDDAFEELTRSRVGAVRETCSPATDETHMLLGRNGWIRFLRRLRPFADEELCGKLFDAVDTDRRGYIDKTQFRRMIVLFAELHSKRLNPMNGSVCPTSPGSSSSVASESGKEPINSDGSEPSSRSCCNIQHMLSRKWWGSVLDSVYAAFFFDLVILANTVLVICDLQLLATDPSYESSQREKSVQLFRDISFGIFVFEVVSKAIAFGPCTYWKGSLVQKFDIAVVVISLVSTLIELLAGSSFQYSRGLTFLRVIRLLRIMRFLPEFTIMLRSFRDTFPVLFQYLVVLICVMYLFAIMGMELFASRLDCGQDVDTDISYCSLDYEKLNFDTLGRSFVSLFYQMVVNNFPILMEGAVNSTSRGARLFFVAYIMVLEVLVLNILVAFIIESFSIQRERNERSYGDRSSVLAPEETGTSSYEETQDWSRPSTSEKTWFGRLLERCMKGKVDYARLPPERMDYWKSYLLASGEDFSQWKIWRRPHAYDVYDRIYAEIIKDEYPEIFSLEGGEF